MFIVHDSFAHHTGLAFDSRPTSVHANHFLTYYLLTYLLTMTELNLTEPVRKSKSKIYSKDSLQSTRYVED